MEQIDDIRNAITWFENQPEVDPDRVGLWGTSFGGAHAPYAAAVDGRVKVAVGQVGFGDGERFIYDTISHGERTELSRKLSEDRRARVIEGKGESVDPLKLALRSSQSGEFLPAAVKAFPQLACELSWETVEKTLEYKPIDCVDRIAPRALMLIAAAKDNVCIPEGYYKLYERAGEPKKWVSLPITHYEIYSGKWFEESARLAIEWYDHFLK